MSDLVFYTNPQSRGQIARWMLEEVGQPYETEVLDYLTTMKTSPICPSTRWEKSRRSSTRAMSSPRSRRSAAISPTSFPRRGLRPHRPSARTIIAGSSSPPARSSRRSATRPRAGSRRRSGSECSATAITISAIDTLEKALTGREYIAADHFTAADLFVGANVNFMLAFNLLEPRETFVDYARRMTDREAYRRARDIDAALIAQAQAQQPQPA